MIVFAGREYRPTAAELDRVGQDLERRAAAPHDGMFRTRADDTFGPLGTRIRESIGPPETAVELQAHEAAALLLSTMTANADSAELARFVADYIAENEWTRRPFFDVYNRTQRVTYLLGLQIGRWFAEDAIETPIGGFDEDGDDLPPRAADFAALAGANGAFADVATAWARFNGTLRVDEMLAWLRQEREEALATADAAEIDEVERARSGARAWALREAALWLETIANRFRVPWDPPRHQA